MSEFTKTISEVIYDAAEENITILQAPELKEQIDELEKQLASKSEVFAQNKELETNNELLLKENSELKELNAKFSDEEIVISQQNEIKELKEAIKQKKPIFSVCRGTQLFNVAMGGSLYQDIEDHWQDTSAEYTTQRLVTEPDTILREIYGEISHINSFHHQSIKDLASNLKVVAHDPKDGIIEAVTTTDGFPYLGVQWHPEFLFENRPKDKELFNYIVNEL